MVMVTMHDQDQVADFNHVRMQEAQSLSAMRGEIRVLVSRTSGPKT